MASIDVHKVDKKFGKVTALEDVSFSVADGEFFCLLGPSGAGKTTTLKIVAGLVEPGGGTVHIDGVDVGDVEPTHRDLAMCFENYALYPQLNVFDNLASPLRSPLSRTPADEIRHRIAHTAGLLGIDHLLDRSVTQLSNGQRQRVALGRVLVRPARAYLLDEPLAHLDAKLRATMRAELKSISGGDATTTIYVTHDYVEALSLADRIGVIRDGRILQVGTPGEVWSAPANAFVAQAFGKPRINLVPGALVASDDGQTFASADGAFQVPVPSTDVGEGTEVQIGIRPRDLRLHTGAGDVPDGQVRLEGSVYVLEHLGRNTEVTVAIGQSRLSVIVPRSEVSSLARDDKVGVLMNPHTVHVFLAGAEGKRVSP
ncbi:ABC transporter ATP-binding protein [Stackebrandtia nassauensis]|uniref:ABC transporter related protein n=1 Tax=Stackebrandtia nassauensis (strain DSM 44728 / CIP 108903 / NRRL B-16338 / NBRC 102104 / LLR-40K-21) TaxID=446470 RepID=D3Q0X7_STANL|nr:ABC transporter ATP-binding protein [Stackebrandtia nassauensis]ADD43727.1 ABC transporter related protein [Stackebrandtia nassauensis DSM 44728]